MANVRNSMEDIAPEPPQWRRPAGQPTRLPYRVRALGRVRGEPYHSTPGTHHADAMLTVILSGRGVYRLGGARHVVGRGMVGLILGTDSQPGVLMADPAEPYDHLYCRFTGSEAAAVAARLRSQFPAHRFRPHDSWQELADVLLRAISLPGFAPVRPHDRTTRHDALLAEALAILDSPAPGGPVKLTADRLRTHLEHRLAHPADLDAIARHFAVSKGHLCREARRLLGQPLHHYLEGMKMEWAAVLLGEPTLTVAEVARRVGYHDPLYFSKVFRKRRGMPPSAMRS